MEENTGAQHDSWAWLESEELQWLPPALKVRIKGRVLVACSEVCSRNLQPGETRWSFCSEAFHVICEELFDVGQLTEQLLMSDRIPKMVAAAEQTFWPRQAIVPPTIMRLWILRRLRYWEGKLILANSSPQGTKRSRPNGAWKQIGGTGAGSGKRKLDDELKQLKLFVREIAAEVKTHEKICGRLKNHPRPPHAGWRQLSWPEAFRKHPNAVRAWISKTLHE